MIGTLWYYWPRLSNWFKNRIQKSKAKYRRRWLAKYNSHAINYILPEQFNYQPKNLSQESVDRLGAVFLEGEKKLKHGFSRQLIINILTKLGKLDDKEQKAFLAASGYRTMRKRILCSCNMREFLQLIESKVTIDENSISNERQFVDDFISEYNEEIQDFDERVEMLIFEIESKNMGSNDDELNKQEKKKYEEEKKKAKELQLNQGNEPQNQEKAA
eukprot:403372090